MIVSQGCWLSLPVRDPLEYFPRGEFLWLWGKLTPSWFPDLVSVKQLEPVVRKLTTVRLWHSPVYHMWFIHLRVTQNVSDMQKLDIFAEQM